MPAKTAATRRVSAICPERLYPLRAFQEASGVGSTRMREGRLTGIHLATFNVGRRKFCTGAAAIEYLQALAALTPSK